MKMKNMVLCLVSLVVGVAGTLFFLDPPQLGQSACAQSASPATRSLPRFTPEEQQNIAVYENVNQSVVNIATETYEMYLSFHGLKAAPSNGIGSGSVLDRQGHILTNNHVIEDAQEIQVTLHDGKTYVAKVVGRDPQSDVAVLKINAPRESLFPVQLGSSTDLRIGQKVYAIGNPFGFERTLSTGIIASLNRTLSVRKNHRIRRLIQIDASINPGNSGGPLLDSQGRLIGMNTAIASMAGDSAGVGFAIPVNDLARIIPPLIKDGRLVRADIGILTVYEHKDGLLIRTLDKNGPAQRAGLRGPKVVTHQKQKGPYVYQYKTIDRTAADLIVAIDGRKIESADQFQAYIEDKKPGESVTLSIVRNGKSLNVPIVLDPDG
ncbi:MAG: trypsin-like peptidase domain-containing protein [Planctomycetia bacterium]|jgi:S1-C subfamily serine protease